jgi:hypothetical protein
MTRFSNVAEVTKFRSVFEGICAQRERKEVIFSENFYQVFERARSGKIDDVTVYF